MKLYQAKEHLQSSNAETTSDTMEYKAGLYTDS